MFTRRLPEQPCKIPSSFHQVESRGLDGATWWASLGPKSSYEDPWADPRSRSTSGLYNLHHRSTGVHFWGDLLLGSCQGSGYVLSRITATCGFSYVFVCGCPQNKSPAVPTSWGPCWDCYSNLDPMLLQPFGVNGKVAKLMSFWNHKVSRLHRVRGSGQHSCRA